MRSRRLLAAAIALLAATPAAHAKVQPQIQDPKGDYPVGVGDIVSLTFTTPLKGIKEQLQIDMELAADPSTNTPYAYEVRFVAEDCNFVAIYFGHPFDGVFSKSGVGCQTTETPPEGVVKVSGTHIVFTVKFTSKIKRGTLLENLTAATAPGGALSGGLAARGGDSASGDEWVVGSDRPKKKK
jgi:hypothetical protein